MPYCGFGDDGASFCTLYPVWPELLWFLWRPRHCLQGAGWRRPRAVLEGARKMKLSQLKGIKPHSLGRIFFPFDSEHLFHHAFCWGRISPVAEMQYTGCSGSEKPVHSKSSQSLDSASESLCQQLVARLLTRGWCHASLYPPSRVCVVSMIQCCNPEERVSFISQFCLLLILML